jgi:hypothetical protein
MEADCASFQRKHARELEQYCERINRVTDDPPIAYAAHDFWLTRNHEGAGFWDRGLGSLGDDLTNGADAYGECWLVVGDDGKLYIH